MKSFITLQNEFTISGERKLSLHSPKDCHREKCWRVWQCTVLCKNILNTFGAVPIPSFGSQLIPTMLLSPHLFAPLISGKCTSSLCSPALRRPRLARPGRARRIAQAAKADSEKIQSWKLWMACAAAVPGSFQYGFGISAVDAVPSPRNL